MKVSRIFKALPFLLVVSLLFPAFIANGHGVISATAKIEHREFNVVEIQVQFDLIKLLNHQSKSYPLPLVASLPKEKFALLYTAVKKLFARSLTAKIGDKSISLNHRFPSQQAMYDVLSRQFLEQNLPRNKADPYTFSERRFYQVAYFDFRIKHAAEIKNLHVTFPKELGDVGVTFVKSFTKEVHSGDSWSYPKA